MQPLKYLDSGGATRELKVPALPAATALLIEMCHDVEVSYEKLAKTIQSDGGLAVRILRVANSAYYSQSGEVSTVVRALTVLGLNEVRNIGLSYRLMNVIQDLAGSSFDFQAYWEKSLIMAILAKEIAREMGSNQMDEAFLAGLLQDIGIVILRFNEKDDYSSIPDAATGGDKESITDLERRVFGTDHAQVGAKVCEEWKFPKTLVRSVRLHHTPPEQLRVGDGASELHAAAYAASRMPDFLDGFKPIQIISDLEQRGILSGESLEPIFERAHAAFEVLAILFASNLPSESRSAGMMSQAIVRLKEMSVAQQRVYEPPA